MPTGPSRVSVVGNSGSGKSTLARAPRRRASASRTSSSMRCSTCRVGPNGRSTEFKALIVERTSGDGWVVDGNYRLATDRLVWPRADTLVWLDLPRRKVMRQVVGRTLRRTITREELWNGNREPLSNLYQLDPHRSIIRWAWTQHDKYQGPVRRGGDRPCSSPISPSCGCAHTRRPTPGSGLTAWRPPLNRPAYRSPSSSRRGPPPLAPGPHPDRSGGRASDCLLHAVVAGELRPRGER